MNPDRVTRALRLAAEVHQDQRLPGTDLPYLTHIAQVMAEVQVALLSEPTDLTEEGELSVLCAILHDTIEDTDCTYAQLIEAFGQRVADGVDALSKRPHLDKAEAMSDSLNRIRSQPHAIWKVKLADRICNLQAPPHYWSRAKALRYQEEARKILAALQDASPVLAARLSARIECYTALLPD